MKYIKTASILGLIAVICAAIIAAFSLITSPIIKNNNANKELETYKVIDSRYDHSFDITDKLSKETLDYDLIEKAIIAYDIDNNELGYIYTVTGKNSYGTISLMIGVANGYVFDVEFLSNTESFSSTVNDYVKSHYPSSKTNAIYIGFNEAIDDEINKLSKDDILNMDTKCGATYGAKLVQKLVLAAVSAEVLQ